ncbi:serine/threonine-protein kinase [Actinosynnema sp. NPDC020468]|uniref:serine/threonine-protein kinase n=1 Tax=Actinosynnema sp. NPDC020468 TaxID=3154488 RepID=UPI0033D88B79
MAVAAHVGLVAGRYRLDGLLGEGRTATVHRAWDSRLRRPVALKFFHTPTTHTDDDIRTLACMSHPGLVSVYDAGTDPDHGPFVVMHLVEGRTLRQDLTDGPMSPVRVRKLGAQIAATLTHLHEHGTAHRNISPGNVLVEDDQVAYLADFGMPNTHPYAAPEANHGTAADIHALGVVLRECLTGTVTDAEQTVPTIPADLRKILRWMTSKNPRNRPTAKACLATFKGAPLDDDGEVLTARVSRKVLVASLVAVLSLVGTSWIVSPDLQHTPAATVAGR